MKKAITVAAGMLCFVTSLMLLLCETGFRLVDGYALSSLPLVSNRGAAAPAKATNPALTAFLEAAKNSSVADISLASLSPEYTPPPAEPEPFIRERLAKYPSDPYGCAFVWNINYVRKAVCEGSTLGSLGILNEFVTFTPSDNSTNPPYRHYPNIHHAGMFKANSFGWRSPEISVEKPARTIRIAFLGSSTVVNGYGELYSFPELINHWLNAWAKTKHPGVRFELENTARTGVDTQAVATILSTEVLPTEPDLVVYYGIGGNEFSVGDYVKLEGTPPPPMTFEPPDYQKRLELYSAFAIRLFKLKDKLMGYGQEPKKPKATVTWPAAYDEFSPDPANEALPARLPIVFRSLDAMREGLRGIRSRLVMTSNLVCVYDGMKLDMNRNAALYRFVNSVFWPYSYAYVNRMVNFHNRVLKAYAQKNGVDFIDVASQFPMEPTLFGDAMHVSKDGARIQAWIIFNGLLPIIESELAAGTLPKPSVGRLKVHPAFQEKPRLVTRAELLTQCEKK